MNQDEQAMRDELATNEEAQLELMQVWLSKGGPTAPDVGEMNKLIDREYELKTALIPADIELELALAKRSFAEHIKAGGNPCKWGPEFVGRHTHF